MANVSFGELNPAEIIQGDTRACLSACILSQTDPEAGLSEHAISEVLIEDGLYIKGLGTSLYPAKQLDASLRKIGLAALPVFDARLRGNNENQAVIERLAAVEKAIKSGQSVILAYPKRRKGQPPLLHYSVVTGFEELKMGNGVTILDPSDVDGGIHHPSWAELKKYVTPTNEVPVMAWGITEADQAPADIRQRIAEGGLPGFSLLARPLSEPEDIGKPLPTGTEHACSTAMTTSEITKQFAQLGSVVLSRNGEQPIGYPRFVVPGAVKELAFTATGHMSALPFPTRQAAEAALYPQKTYGNTQMPDSPEGVITEKDGLFWLADTKFNVDAWQHTGLGISSRQAQANLEGRPDNDLKRRNAAEAKIKQAIETHTGAAPEDIYLFPTGMAAMYWLNQALIKSSGGLPGVQFGFPYTDTYDQRLYGPNRNVTKNVIDIRNADYSQLQSLSDSGEEFRGVTTEYPSNPLLWTPDFDRLEHSLNGNTPIVVDDTIGTMFNLEDTKLPDSVVARVTSLTKYFSSVGDVMGGSLILRPSSPHYEQLKVALDGLYENTLWYEDAEALAANSRLFPEIMPVINKNGEQLAQWLHEEKTGEGGALRNVFHPSISGRKEYAAVKKDDGGYGGLLSLRFKSSRQAFRFFDRLKVTKGPSLGTYYTLGCLYTLLAHKDPDSVKKFGVAPDLIRLSVGIEDVDQLKERMEDAF